MVHVLIVYFMGGAQGFTVFDHKIEGPPPQDVFDTFP